MISLVLFQRHQEHFNKELIVIDFVSSKNEMINI